MLSFNTVPVEPPTPDGPFASTTVPVSTSIIDALTSLLLNSALATPYHVLSSVIVLTSITSDNSVLLGRLFLPCISTSTPVDF